MSTSFSGRKEWGGKRCSGTCSVPTTGSHGWAAGRWLRPWPWNPKEGLLTLTFISQMYMVPPSVPDTGAYRTRYTWPLSSWTFHTGEGDGWQTIKGTNSSKDCRKSQVLWRGQARKARWTILCGVVEKGSMKKQHLIWDLRERRPAMQEEERTLQDKRRACPDLGRRGSA